MRGSSPTVKEGQGWYTTRGLKPLMFVNSCEFVDRSFSPG